MGQLRYYEPTGGVWVPIPTMGPVGPPGATGISVTGPTGPTGPTGTQGVSTIIVGSFGSGTGTPATLPPTGALVAGFTSPGSPAYQMVIGESLYYEAPTGSADPLDGHLYQFMTTAVNAAGWVDIGLIQGPRGPSGPSGPTGPMSDELWIGPAAPVATGAELWYDTDDTRILGPAEMPVGGLANDALVKNTDIDGDVKWRNLHVMEAGEVIQFPNIADVPKINLYSTSFGLGITSGSLTMYASSTFRFRQNSVSGTEWAYIDATRVRHGGHDLQRQMYQNGNFTGPWDGTDTALWTPTLVAGNYWVMFGASGSSTTVAARTIDLKFDDVVKATARSWINTVNAHEAFVNGVGMIGAVTAGSHTIKIVNGGGTGSDVNDYGWVILVPYT